LDSGEETPRGVRLSLISGAPEVSADVVDVAPAALAPRPSAVCY